MAGPYSRKTDYLERMANAIEQMAGVPSGGGSGSGAATDSGIFVIHAIYDAEATELVSPSDDSGEGTSAAD